MNHIIKKAETYCLTLKGNNEQKESMLYAKFGSVLNIETIKKISLTF